MDIYLDNYRYLRELITALIDFANSKYGDVYGHISELHHTNGEQDYSKTLQFTVDELNNGVVASCFEYDWQDSAFDVIRDRDIVESHIRSHNE